MHTYEETGRRERTIASLSTDSPRGYSPSRAQIHLATDNYEKQKGSIKFKTISHVIWHLSCDTKLGNGRCELNCWWARVTWK